MFSCLSAMLLTTVECGIGTFTNVLATGLAHYREAGLPCNPFQIRDGVDQLAAMLP